MTIRFSTAPQIKSDNVVRIVKAGKINELIKAVEFERKEISTKSDQIKVVRVGASSCDNKIAE